jgi:nicotinamide phosphoribosyltransferase
MKLFAAFLSDGYKGAHGMMYADGTEVVSSNLTPRSDSIYRRSCTEYYNGKLVVLGHQGAVMEVVEMWDDFFKMDKGIALGRFKLLCDSYFGYDLIQVDHLSKLHDLGYLPLEIRTLDEGSKVNMGIPVLTIRNTVAHAFWLVNFLETVISNLTWKPSTAATIAAEYRAMLTDYAIRTGTALEVVNIQAHSFADRGMSGPEDAARSGFGHVGSFLGSDSLGTVLYAQQYYKAGNFVACSVPATEHAVSTSNILRIESELMFKEYNFVTIEQSEIYTKMAKDNIDIRLIAEIMFMYELMLKFPVGILSYVADSFDFYGLISRGLPYMKDVIMRRQSNGVTPGRLVIRPDSGDPVEVLCGVKVHDMSEFTSIEIEEQSDDSEDSIHDISYGYVNEVNGGDEVGFFVRSSDGLILHINGEVNHSRYYDMKSLDGYSASVVDLTIEQKGAVEVLMDIFGYTETSTGHKLLDDHIGLIYGDSITTNRCQTILERLFDKGYASGNAMFGVGSYTYQCVTRDSLGFAVKATYTEVNGKAIPIFKDPKTDSKKKSAKGLLYVGKNDLGDYVLTDNVTREIEEHSSNELKIRFLDGSFYNQTSLDEIRAKLMV